MGWIAAGIDQSPIYPSIFGWVALVCQVNPDAFEQINGVFVWLRMMEMYPSHSSVQNRLVIHTLHHKTYLDKVLSFPTSNMIDEH